MINDVKNDDGSFSLRPKARVLKTLGEELISSETVALIELIKNSYDADAKNVLIEFNGKIEKGKGDITIYDDGHGMDMHVIHDAWMTIATSHKKNNTISKGGSRRVLGEKGIGRFATQRIASELELVSRTESNEKEIYTIFDWEQFENDDLYLEDVVFLTDERVPEDIVKSSPIRELPTKKDGEPSGTILKMNRLKHTWENKDYVELNRGLSRLVSPFSPVDDFNIYFKKHNVMPVRIDAPEVINYPHYKIKGKVKSCGEYDFGITVEDLGKEFTKKGFYYRKLDKGEWVVEPTEIAPNKITKDELKEIECGEFEFELRVWDRDDLGNVDQKIGSGIRSIRSDLDAIAGINIYRDGFRVLPYGEPNNDWLRLDIRRVQKPTKHLSNNQITGYIAISANNNPKLHDRSNREGLDNNTAYTDLVQIMELILTEFENIRYVTKRPKGKVGSTDSTTGLFEQPDFSQVKKAIKEEKTDSTETLELISKVESDWKKQIKNFQNVLSKYHSLATLGGIVDKVLHDGRQPLASIQTEAGLGREAAEDLMNKEESINPEEIDALENGFSRVVDMASILHDVFKRVEPFGGRKRGRPKKYYIEDLIKDTFDIYKRELSSASVNVELPDSQTLVSTDVTEISEIFTNLITNSLYWLGRVEKNKRKIQVQLERLNDGGLAIIFADTGPGVDAEIKDSIFEPYVSNRTGGHGLGLCLVGEIVKSYYNGSVELLDSGKIGGAVFRLVIRKRV